MSDLFYSDESKSVQRKVKIEMFDNVLRGAVDFELDRCVKWIIDNNFKRIGLQFPDYLLDYAADIKDELELRTQKEIFVLADSTYGRLRLEDKFNQSFLSTEYQNRKPFPFYFSCCIDEVLAKHMSSDAIIHFGHACLSHYDRLPVLYIFGKDPLDVSDVVSAFKTSFPDLTHPIILYYEVNYYHAISKIAENLIEYENLVISELLYPNEESKAILNEDQIKIIQNQRYFILPKTRKLEDYTIFYIGCQRETITNVMLCLNNCKFYMYNTLDQTVTDDAFNANRFLRQRNYYIEKARDARIIGILTGTLGVSNYLRTIMRLRQGLIAANKKFYSVTIGKINMAKMANFNEIEVFVNVACLESTIVDCKGLFQPIITPYEMEIALNIRKLTDRLVLDFTELLPDGEHHVPLNDMKHETDVSLITGMVRTFGFSGNSDESSDESDALVQRDDMTISEIHSGGAGEFLSERSWKGLEQKLGETPPADILQGRKGIASGYEDERIFN